MAFNSSTYLLFLPVVFLVFSLAPDRFRWLTLLAGSYLFYGALHAPYLLAVLLMVTTISFGCALRMASHTDESIRCRWLWIGTIACVAVLALIKYLPFFASQAGRLFVGSSAASVLVVSIGVSYFTFQAISYLADVYLEVCQPETHFGYYALYLAFFPKLLQGPIERAGDLLPQLRRPFQFDSAAVQSGLVLFCWGLFKKVVVADRLALYADQVFGNLHSYTGLPLFVGTYAYAFQIYFDFAGYSDMACGTGLIFGITLTQNFNRPYLATSIADFWRRWHISFSRWILDYIFKPLQMSWRQGGQAGSALALLVTFLVSGIWHGAKWGFVIWGLLHGIFLASSTYYRPYQKKLHRRLGIEKSGWLRFWQILATFNLVSLAWIFFRAQSLDDAFYVINNLFRFNFHQYSGAAAFFKSQILLGVGRVDLIFMLAGILVLAVAGSRNILSICEKPVCIKWPAIYALLLAIIFFGKFQQSSFIYFKF